MESYLSSFGRLLNGALAGMVGGAVASWVMNQYITQQQQQAAAHGLAPEAATNPKAASPQEQKQPDKEDDATVKTAQAISRRYLGRELSATEKKIAGPAVHYAYGTLVGGLYGATAEVTPLVSAGFGMLYGMALWGLGDEIAVPALRLGPPATEIAPGKHADFLGAHLVYGITLDLTRRIARHVV